jgi:hypothetical protein
MYFLYPFKWNLVTFLKKCNIPERNPRFNSLMSFMALFALHKCDLLEREIQNDTHEDAGVHSGLRRGLSILTSISTLSNNPITFQSQGFYMTSKVVHIKQSSITNNIIITSSFITVSFESQGISGPFQLLLSRV